MSKPTVHPFAIGFDRKPENATNLKRVNGRPASKKRLMEKEPYYYPDEAPSAWGLILHVLPLIPAASVVFSPEELEDRIEAHSRRVEAEQRRLADGLKKYKKNLSIGGVERIPDWVCAVNCCSCQKLLLSLSQPGLFEINCETIQKKREKDLRRLAKKFPVPACWAPFKGHPSHWCDGCASSQGLVPTREPERGG